jgi:copper chaperone CopZ
MDENCYVEPMYRNVPTSAELQNSDVATLAVWGMGCQNCVTRVRNSLLSLEGVYGVDVYLNMALAEVRYNTKQVGTESLVEAVSAAGNDGRHHYRAELIALE